MTTINNRAEQTGAVISERPRCQCPEKAERSILAETLRLGYEPEEEKARQHEPYECPGDYQLAQYRRGDEVLWLCSCCTFFGDERLTDESGLTPLPAAEAEA